MRPDSATPWHTEWTGEYRYDVAGPGCHWSFHKPNYWKLTSSQATFSVLAAKIRPLLKSLRREFESAIPTATTFPTDFTFLDWARLPHADDEKRARKVAVMSGAALMLNNVISSSTVRPFKILSTFVGRHVTSQIKGLPANLPCWFYRTLETELILLDEYLLTFPGQFFKLDKDSLPLSVLPAEQLRPVIQRLRSHRLLNQFEILKYTNEGDHFVIQVRCATTLTPYERGAFCGCIPIPGPVTDKDNEKDEPSLVATPEIVVTSPRVATALERLSRVWADRFAKSVLLSAPPGSGKENLATSIPFGQGRPSDHFTPISLASSDPQSLERLLYGRKREDGSIEPGLLAQAQADRSAVFLDEVHQPEDQKTSVRPSLLRPLESNEYFPVGSGRPEAIRDVLFVLATSKLVRDLERVPPQDFWTRMTHVVPIKHPLDFLDGTDGVTRGQVIQDFFKCFWWDRAKSFYKVEPARRFEQPEDKARLLPVQQAQAILHPQNLTKAAESFARALLRALRTRRKQPRHCSIRGIRSMTSRLFSIAANEIANGRDDTWLSTFTNHLDDIVKEIMPMALVG